MDKFDLRTILFDKAYDYIKENPNKLTKEQEKKLLDSLTELTKTMKKVDCKELRDFLLHLGLIEDKTATTNTETHV